MKLVFAILVLGLAPMTVFAAADDGDCPGANCTQHMCPVACSATKAGFEEVSKLPLVHVNAGEFLA